MGPVKYNSPYPFTVYKTVAGKWFVEDMRTGKAADDLEFDSYDQAIEHARNLQRSEKQ